MKLAADANVLLSAVIGGRARLVLSHPEIEHIYTTAQNLDEVREYAVLLGKKKGLRPEILMLEIAALPAELVERSVYESAIKRAESLIGERDPDDVELLALALALEVQLWTNDNDFEHCGIEWFTTAQILRKLGISQAM